MTARGKGVGVANWLVSKTSGFFDSRLTRRSFISRATLLGSAVAATGLAACTRPGSPYTRVTDCPSGSLCRDGYTEFCCVINKGVNACPSGTIAAGWWRADGSPYCPSGTRYYIDCNETCCGPARSDGFCAGCSPCRCANGCNTRKVHCNYFRYGQCNQGTRVGPIACRMVACTPPYNLNIGCSPSGAVDNSTRNHFTDCNKYKPPPPPPPSAAVLPMAGVLVGDGSNVPHVFARFNDGSLRESLFDGSSWSPWTALGGGVTSGIAAEWFNGKLYVFARRTSSQSIYYQVWNGSSWSPWVSLGGVLYSDPMTVVAGSSLFLFAQGGGNVLYYRRFDGSTWSRWVSLGGIETSTPVPLWFNSILWVFIRGYERSLWYQRTVGTKWASSYSGLAGKLASDPTVVEYNAGISVFVRGDNALLYHRRYNGSWTGGVWLHVSNAPAFASDPVAVSHAGKMWVFTRLSNGTLQYGSFDGSAWSAWQTLDTGIDCDPAVRVIDGTLYVQADTTSATSHLWTHDGTSWGSVYDLGGPTAPFRARSK